MEDRARRVLHDTSHARVVAISHVLRTKLLARRETADVQLAVSSGGHIALDADGPDHGPVNRQAPQREGDRTLRAGCRPAADDDWIGRVVGPLEIVRGHAVRVDGRVLASRIPADGVRVLVALVDLQAGPARGADHRRGGGANTAAHCTGVIAQAADDDAAQGKTMCRIDWADSAQEAELLARANDQAVEVGGRLADVLAVTVAHVREERRGPLSLASVHDHHARDIGDVGNVRANGGSDHLEARGPAAAGGEGVEVGRNRLAGGDDVYAGTCLLYTSDAADEED